jgi:hypothetical protein
LPSLLEGLHLVVPSTGPSVSSVRQCRLSGSPLPELSDANMSAMAREGFTLSGIQVEEGVGYAQSWWCRLVD